MDSVGLIRCFSAMFFFKLLFCSFGVLRAQHPVAFAGIFKHMSRFWKELYRYRPSNLFVDLGLTSWMLFGPNPCMFTDQSNAFQHFQPEAKSCFALGCGAPSCFCFDDPSGAEVILEYIGYLLPNIGCFVHPNHTQTFLRCQKNQQDEQKGLQSGN